MTADQTGLVDHHNKVLPVLTMDGSVQEYLLTTPFSDPDFTVRFQCQTDAWGFSTSPDGPFFPIAAGAPKFVHLTHSSMSVYVQSTGAGDLYAMEDEHAIAQGDDSRLSGPPMVWPYDGKPSYPASQPADAVLGDYALDIRSGAVYQYVDDSGLTWSRVDAPMKVKTVDTLSDGATEATDAELTYAIGAGESWHFRALLMVSGMSSNTQGFLGRFAFPNDMTSGALSLVSFDSNPEFWGNPYLPLAAGNNPGNWHTTIFYDSADKGAVQVEGTFTNGPTAFDLQVKWAQGHASTPPDAIKLRAGSFLEARRLL